MAVVDSLLDLVESQQAQGLVIASDAVPELVLDDGPRLLSMPAIPAEKVHAFAREVAETDGGEESRYRTGGGALFEVRVEGEGPSLRLTFSRVAAEAEISGAAEPSPRAGSGAPRPPLLDESAGARRARPDDAPDARLLDLLARMERERASDLLLSSGLPPRLRAGGELRALDAPRLDDAGILALLAPALHPAARRTLEERGSVDLALALGGRPGALRFRVNLFRQQHGLAAALRPIRQQPPTLSELSLPERLQELVAYPNGLVLVTGPAGAGKSTTLAALTEHLNATAARHVVTLEDPIEYAYAPRRCLIHQRELGRHVDDFAGGLRAALRESPDVIVVGEMRDRDTIAAAITAAETGHLVLSTLHSANPWMAVDRMIDVFPGDQQARIRAQLPAVLRAVLSQHLLVSSTPPLRVPAYELLRVTPAAANQIREDKVHQLQSTIQTGSDDGMVSFESSLAALVRAGRIDERAAQALARDAHMLAHLAGA